jgi:hypothetical protein
MRDPPLISDAHIIAIGHLVVAVSKIDILLTDLAAAMLRIDNVYAIAAIHHQQIASKIDTLKTLVRLRSKRGAGALARPAATVTPTQDVELGLCKPSPDKLQDGAEE